MGYKEKKKVMFNHVYFGYALKEAHLQSENVAAQKKKRETKLVKFCICRSQMYRKCFIPLFHTISSFIVANHCRTLWQGMFILLDFHVFVMSTQSKCFFLQFSDFRYASLQC